MLTANLASQQPCRFHLKRTCQNVPVHGFLENGYVQSTDYEYHLCDPLNCPHWRPAHMVGAYHLCNVEMIFANQHKKEFTVADRTACREAHNVPNCLSCPEQFGVCAI